jgi:hypothetical protein
MGPAIPSKEKPMRNFVCGSVGVVLLVAAGIGHGGDQNRLEAPRFSAEFAKCGELVLPNATEQSYRKIGWRTSVLQGVVDAQKNDKPVMIVLMNGHPLGCT